MDFFSKSSRWKLYLGILGIIILIMPWFFANYLAKKLKEGEKAKVEIYSKTLQKINDTKDDLNADVTYELHILETIKDIPIVTVDETGKVMDMINFPEGKDTLKALNELKSSGIPPIEGFGYASKIYYKDPSIIQWLSYFPIFQIILLCLYGLIGYLVFSASRKEEQNRIWVGMAKETAHQMGTPISGIMGWIENLKSSDLSQAEQNIIIHEMEHDVNKLQQVADRFSKIGSAPELQSHSLFELLTASQKYMQARAPKSIQFEFPVQDENILAKINPNLFSWVIENLLRNALDAMDGKGKITAKIYADHNKNFIEIKDTGQGIPSNKHQLVFRPGYTTKKRGWGLGLSLAKRIIENYHKGRIYIKESSPGHGTTFIIELPLAKS